MGDVSMRVVAVSAKATHAFSKDRTSSIHLIAGQGVAGDAHSGVTVKHRSRVARDPAQPNLRQVHLIHSELLAELASKGLHVLPGQMGENITTIDIPLLALSQGTLLGIGRDALVQITGLRNPCSQIESFMPGLLAAVLDRTAEGTLVRKAGVMGIVIRSGNVQPDDLITVVQSPPQYVPLQPV
jgi:MOSC domain-containing protein YiiM